MFLNNKLLILFSALGLIVTISFVYLVVSLSMSPQEASIQLVDD